MQTAHHEGLFIIKAESLNVFLNGLGSSTEDLRSREHDLLCFKRFTPGLYGNKMVGNGRCRRGNRETRRVEMARKRKRWIPGMLWRWSWRNVLTDWLHRLKEEITGNAQISGLANCSPNLVRQRQEQVWEDKSICGFKLYYYEDAAWEAHIPYWPT